MRFLPLAIALLSVATVLAGCSSGPSEPSTPPPQPGAVLATIGGATNQRATFDPQNPTRQANELSIAVNPKDPLNLIATGKDYTQPWAGQCVWDGIYVTHDGGATWKDANLIGSPWFAQSEVQSGRAPPSVDTRLSKFYCATDPVVTFAPDGTAYWAVMPYQCDPASGSRTGKDQVGPGGLNDWFWTCSSMYVLASTDGGDSWPTVSEVAFGGRLENDKMWIAATNERVVLCWDQDAWLSGAARDDYNALRQGTPLPPFPIPTDQLPQEPKPTGTVCSASTDKAVTWTQPRIADYAAAIPWIEADADGGFHMAAIDGQHVLYLHSQDGLDWSGGARILGNYTDPANALMNGFTSLNGSAFRTFALPSLAVDASGGRFSGAMYVTWMDAASGAGRVMLSISHDQGATWSPPTWIHQLAANDGDQRGDQFMPAVSVGPDGTVDLSWMDRRVDPKNHLFDCFYAYSTDGGVTFSQPMRVSNVSSDEQYSHHQNGVVFLGDYRDSASSPGAAHPVWVDTRNQRADVYTATILRPGVA